MNKILLASHGPLANGMKKTAEFLMGQNENVETLCAYVDEQSKDLPAMVEKWMNERNPEDQWVVITDIFGGSINNEFMIRAQEGGYWLIAPDVITGGVLGAAFAISTGKGADVPQLMML